MLYIAWACFHNEFGPRQAKKHLKLPSMQRVNGLNYFVFSDVLERTFVSTVLFQGKSETIEHIHLLSSAVLQVGGEFTAVLTGVALVSGTH